MSNEWRERLAAAGKSMAQFYLAALALVVLVSPFVMGAAFMWVTVVLADGLRLPHYLGLAALALYFGFCFAAFLFFPIFAWPHVSPKVRRVFNELIGGAHDH